MMKKLFAIVMAVALLAGCNKEEKENEQKYMVLDFESVPTKQMAGPTAYGDNLYTPYDPSAFENGADYDKFVSYHDAATDLQWKINDAAGDGQPQFWNGGIAASNWNEMTVYDPTNQCSVYYKASNGKGGCGGSSNFGIVSCSGPAELGFKSAGTERVFDNIWVANSTYAYLCIKNGNDFSTPLEENNGWFKLIINGLDAAGNVKADPIEVYLADYRDETDPKGVLEGWKQVDLSSLGAVNKISFSVEGSDMNGEWLNTPQYVCIDNVVIRL